MPRAYHFITGLPRSGTTLLSAVLNQNPRFSASISGPVARIARAIVTESQAQGGYRTQCPEEKRKNLILNMVDTYYADANEVVFDTNRGWSLLTPMLADLYPDAKIIGCIRDIPWILDSFEQLIAKNPYALTSIFNGAEGNDVYSRAGTLLQPDRTLGFALNALKQAAYGNEQKRLLLVDYEKLCRQPEKVLRALYKFIGEDWFPHDFNDVATSYDEFDADVNLRGMHTTRKRIEFVSRHSVLPPDLWQETAGLSFWKQGR